MMVDGSLNSRLRAGTQPQVAVILKEALKTTDTASLTTNLLSAAETGAIPPTVLYIYTGLSNDPYTVAAALRQKYSTSIRRVAIRCLGRLLEPGPNFASSWTALGGATGIAALMRELSVNEVAYICRVLGRSPTNSDLDARAEQERAMSELLGMLYQLDPDNDEDEDENIAATRELRPLSQQFQYLVQACTLETREQWYRLVNPKEPEVKPRPPYPRYIEPGQEEKLEASADLSAGDSKLSGIDWLLRQGVLRRTRMIKNLLEQIAECDAKDLKIKPGVFMQDIIEPLARKTAKKKLPAGLRGKVWDLIVSCVKRWPQVVDSLNFSQDGVLGLAIRRLKCVPTEERRLHAGRVLQSLIEPIPPAKVSRISDYRSILLQFGNPAQRYQLFTWLLRLNGIDLESPGHGDKANLEKLLETDLPSNLFLLLPSDKMADFLSLVVEVRPDKTFLQPSNGYTILSQHAEPARVTHGDFPILHCMLLSRLSPDDPRRLESEVFSNVESTVKSRIRKSSQSREWSDRYFWAKSALFLCIAVKSYELYSKTLLWARRFNKDSHTLRSLFDGSTIMTCEGLDLLCGIPPSSELSFTPVDTVKLHILKANQIVNQLFETALAALHEPQFNPSDWTSLGKLPSSITRERLCHVNAFQAYHGLSDDEIYNIVWLPTIDMLIEVERIAIEEDNSRLGFERQGGMLEKFTPRKLRDHSWKFLNNLAKARNELWRQKRVARCPAVLTLADPWPKGLPVHALCPLNSFEDTTPKLPYVLSRAEAVVFADSKTLFSPAPTDEETLTAIAGFVEDYKACVRIYLDVNSRSQDENEDIRCSRLAQVWRHAVEQLRGEGWFEEETRLFWIQWVFRSLPDHGQELIKARPRPAGPEFPRTDDAREPIEWHPDPKALPPARGSRRRVPGPLTCLEVMLGGFKYKADHDDVLDWADNSKLRLEQPSDPSFWEPERYKRPLSGETQDVYIAAAILYINSKAGSDMSLLMQPFPEADEPRIPALYLADEFLEASSKEPEIALRCVRLLDKFRDRVPPELLLRLASSLLQRLSSTDGRKDGHSDQKYLTMEVIRLLSKAEQPSIAFGLIQDIVLDKQDDSSWHRLLFHRGFLSRLPAVEARQFLESIVDAIIARLQAAQVQSQEPAQEVKSQPLIKISTVKMLAQVLRGSQFVSKATACDILIRIFENSRHIDIKIAVFESLAETFTTTTDRSLRGKIRDLLRSQVVPIAASLDERHPMTIEDWAKAEAETKLPEIGNTSTFQRPLLQLLLDTGIKTGLDRDWKRDWQANILEPLLFQSIENCRRWLVLFQKVNSLSLPAGESLPSVPVAIDMYYHILLHWPDFISARIFNLVRTYIMVDLFPPPGIAAINSAIRNNRSLSASNAGRFWLSRFGHSFSLSRGVDTVASLVNRPTSFWANCPADGLTVPLLRDTVMPIAESLLADGNIPALNSLVQYLTRLPEGYTYERPERLDCRSAFLTNTLPILRHIVSRIDALRTPQWQADPHRRPHRLPPTFPYRLHMLSFPSTSFHPSSAPAPDSEIRTFAGEIMALIDELTSRNLPYLDDWAAVKAAATRSPVHQSDFLRIALALAEDVADDALLGGREPTTAEYLRVELAFAMVVDAEDPRDDKVLRRVRDLLVLEWAGSRVEMLRERARNVVKRLRGKGSRLGMSLDEIMDGLGGWEGLEALKMRVRATEQ